MVFQFLLGRLETTDTCICAGIARQFQFLLGRLETSGMLFLSICS